MFTFYFNFYPNYKPNQVGSGTNELQIMYINGFIQYCVHTR